MAARDRRRLAHAMVAAAVVSGLMALLVMVTGGFHLPLGPVSISSRKASRPALLALGCAALALWLSGADGRHAARTWVIRWLDVVRAIAARAFRLVPPPAAWALGLALVTGVTAWSYGSQTAGGSDAFAYLSQAALLRTGRMQIPVPLAARAPWPDAADSFAPLGYRARTDGRAAVPITAPGFPLVMAAFQSVGGHRAAFLVTPLAAALLVWLTFLIGRRVGSPGAGLAAAWLVATSPAFLFNAMWPMSDVPAALWAALMTWLLLRTGATTAAAAGLAGGMGLLTRPNFVLVDAAAFGWLVVVALTTRNRESLQRGAAFLVGLVPGALLQAWLNLSWFGRVLASGYGTTGDLLSPGRIGVNAGRYASWLVETSPLLAVGFVAMCLPAAWLWGRDRWRVPLLFASLSLGTVSVYLVYTTFNDWWYLRFLLPAWPLLAVSVAMVWHAAHRRSAWAGFVVACVIVTAGALGFTLARQRGVFLLGEERYATVAALVAASTEPTAIVLTISHSGSVRYYAGRETVRFNAIDPAWLDRALEWLAARGRKPYILLEDWELPEFRARFGGSSDIGRLAFAPAVTWESSTVAGRVFLYDPIERDRFATADPGRALERAQPRAALSRFPLLAFE